MVPWQSPGDILRWWRTDVLKLSQQEAAEQLLVRATTLSNWENATRMISVDIEQIDKTMRADGVLAGLLWAFATPTGIEPARLWSKVFPGPSDPVWMWLRSAEPTIRIEAEWGVFRFEADLDLSPNGVFVTVGASIGESPVVVQLSRPGWVDFGRGDIPKSVPGAQVLSAIEMAQSSTASGVFMERFSTNMAEKFERSRAREVASLGREIPNRLARFFNGFNRSGRQAISGAWPPLPEGVDANERLRFARMRQARGLSLASTAERLALMTDIKVGKDTLRRFENGLGEPHDRLLPVALDYVLGANGHLALVEIQSGRGTGSVRFPYYWHAPVWLAFGGPQAQVPAELHWGRWRRTVEGDLPLLVISHYAEPASSLRIVVGNRVRWTVGVGRRAGAVPIDQGWVPASIDDARQAMAETEAAVLDAIRRSGASEAD